MKFQTSLSILCTYLMMFTSISITQVSEIYPYVSKAQIIFEPNAIAIKLLPDNEISFL